MTTSHTFTADDGEVDWTFKEILKTLNLKSTTKTAPCALQCREANFIFQSAVAERGEIVINKAMIIKE